ncbi:hypothetical protein ACERII_05710 [Evansella sp. AB-rgal1]|uniref:hypothetical protein n=1 Tax=Evansella sp. AB-rgal1 TaxID=3242696 RepID=UPI00359E0958
MLRVLSLAVGKSFKMVEEYQVHAFPYPRTYKFDYVTFRKPGSIMTDLYTVYNTVVFDPINDDITEATNDLPKEEKARIVAYVDMRKKTRLGFSDSDTPYIFWVLKWEESLEHKPRLERGHANPVYYRYEDLVSGDRIVIAASKRDKIDSICI